MSIFNNLLNSAFSVIPQQKILFFEYLGDSNFNGLLVPNFKEPQKVLGSVQAVNSKDLIYLGFSSSKEVLRFFLKLDVSVVSGVAQKGSSKVIFKEKEYILENMTNWSLIDGWSECLGVYNG